MAYQRIYTQQMHEQLSRAPADVPIRCLSYTLAPRREAKRLVKAFCGAADVYPSVVSLHMVDLKLQRGELVRHARYTGRISLWQSLTWQRWEMLIMGPCALVQDFYRIAESLYERS